MTIYHFNAKNDDISRLWNLLSLRWSIVSMYKADILDGFDIIKKLPDIHNSLTFYSNKNSREAHSPRKGPEPS